MKEIISYDRHPKIVMTFSASPYTSSDEFSGADFGEETRRCKALEIWRIISTGRQKEDGYYAYFWYECL